MWYWTKSAPLQPQAHCSIPGWQSRRDDRIVRWWWADRGCIRAGVLHHVGKVCSIWRPCPAVEQPTAQVDRQGLRQQDSFRPPSACRCWAAVRHLTTTVHHFVLIWHEPSLFQFASSRLCLTAADCWPFDNNMHARNRTLRQYAQHARLQGNVVRMEGGNPSSWRDKVFSEGNFAAAQRKKLSGN